MSVFRGGRGGRESLEKRKESISWSPLINRKRCLTEQSEIVQGVLLWCSLISVGHVKFISSSSVVS